MGFICWFTTWSVKNFFTHGTGTYKNFNFFHFSLVFTFQMGTRTGHSTTIAPYLATNSSSEITSMSMLFRRRILLLSSLHHGAYSWTSKPIIFELKVVLQKRPIRGLVRLMWYSSFHHGECQNCIDKETTDNSFQINIRPFKAWWLLYSGPSLILKNSTFYGHIAILFTVCTTWYEFKLYILPEFKWNLWRVNHNFHLSPTLNST
jgi:hypothetical protein